MVLGNATPPRDVGVARVAVSQTSFEDAPVTIQAELATLGCRGEKLVAQLANEAGRIVDTQTVVAPADGEPLAVRFQVRPEQPGVSFYQVRLAPESEKTAFDHPEKSREATLANNRRLVAVDRGGGPYRVLYVAGRPNWEYKFLRRAVDEDQQVQLVSLVRIARREPKFDFRSRSGEATNPLFRGFGNQHDEAAETYDKPVLVRQGTEDAAELRDGFPKTAEDLYRYHAIIVDDLEAEFFTPDQMLLVQKFVSQRGGGFLMLGGQESFAGGKYDRTPLGDLLPVYLDQLPEIHASAGHRIALEREGWLQPWVRLRSTEPEERKRLESMPAFQTLNRVRGIKPGATVLAKVVDDDGWQAPALVEQRFGRGRSLALLVGDLWRWGLKRTDETSDLEKSWRQTVRWLVADVPERIEVEPQSPGDAGGAVRLLVRAHNARFEPLDNATVRVTVTAPGGEKLELSAAPSDDAAGSYRATYVPRQPGAYRAEVSVAGPDGAQLGRRETGWTSDPAADEFRVLRPNRELLEKIARESGGQLVEAAGLAELVTELPNRKVPITEPAITPLWHQSWVFMLAIVCLCGEWGLRRWRGAALIEWGMWNLEWGIEASGNRRPAGLPTCKHAATGAWQKALSHRWNLARHRGAIVSPAIAADEAADKPTVILVVGAAGEEEYQEQFTNWAERLGCGRAPGQADVVRIGSDAESKTTDHDRLRDALASAGSAGGPLWLVLIGHGTFDGRQAKFNLRGPDVDAAELAEWCQAVRRPLAVIDSSSASGPMLNALSGPGRVVVVATKSGNEKNFARFGDFFSTAIGDSAADLDKDGQTSLLEAFLRAAREVDEFYAQQARLATEHALLDDNGDALGTPAAWFQGVRAIRTAKDGAALDGSAAQRWYLVPGNQERRLSPGARLRRDELEQAIAALRVKKVTLAEDEYYAQLEPLLVELARLYAAPAAPGDGPIKRGNGERAWGTTRAKSKRGRLV